MQIIAFDFGIKKIGVAVGQTSTYTSSPLQIIINKDDKINWEEINILLNEWKPELIIVGKPLNMDGTDSEIMKKVHKFFQKLKECSDKFGLTDLSMGMSNDYDVACKFGSTFLRIGTKIFGERG